MVIISDLIDTVCRHLNRSSHIESFAIVSVVSVSKGVRRIVALTGPEAQKVLCMYTCIVS